MPKAIKRNEIIPLLSKKVCNESIKKIDKQMGLRINDNKSRKQNSRDFSLPQDCVRCR